MPPFKSKAQARLFYAAANNPKGIKGLDQNVARHFIQDTEHQDMSKLPDKKPQKFNKIRKLFKGNK